MSDETIVKVERNVMAYWKAAKINPQYGSVKEQRLTDMDKEKMGGLNVAYFYAELQGDKWCLIRRAPTQGW